MIRPGLTVESRMIATPWSRIVRGIGLGQYPIDHDPVLAARLRETVDQLAARVPGDAYTSFARRTTNLILNVTEAGGRLPFPRLEADLDAVLAELRTVRNPYYRVTGGAILLDALAKLEVPRRLIIGGGRDLPAEVLAGVDEIEPDRIEDENSGRHGDYERLSAYTAAFLAHGQWDLAGRLTEGRNYVSEALHLLDSVPAPFFRGRGGSMLLSVAYLLGYGELVKAGGRDWIAETLDHLDRADELNLPPAFPQPMSPAFGKIYPLLTMLNTVAMSGIGAHLTHRHDRLAELRALWGQITPVERTHMGLYYLVALHNLGRLRDEIPDVRAFVTALVGQWRDIDPGENYFLHGIAYPYLIMTALFTGQRELITESMVDRLVDSFPSLDRTDTDRINRPYPFAYAITALSELGATDRLFAPHPRYGGSTPMAWVIGQLPAQPSSRLYMLDHALISSALRMRGAAAGQTGLYQRFRFDRGLFSVS
ncbi:hypothetical protein [Actinoplanes sp. NPDC049265]|uniref:hypothetical protein n=1 Tax=Actinoplanes sp. NPDC049265 TaxID=3363902 RepID=UPI0037186DCD